MAYYLDLFSPETYEAFTQSQRDVSGFRIRQRNAAAQVQPGDKLVCYMTRVSRWCGILEVLSGPFEDSSPIFYADSDPFVVRFRVRPIVWLPVEKAFPVHDDRVWTKLSFTQAQHKETSTWTGPIRRSLGRMNDLDGALIESLLLQQSSGVGEVFPIDVLWLKGRSIRRAFEVEHTTSIYSGILRMADLLALQPNMDISLHIVAPETRRDKVSQELRRPVFSLLDRGPLSDSCTYLSYDSVREVTALPHLAYMSDEVLDQYAEVAED